MKKIITIAAGIAASASVLAACGGAAGGNISEQDAAKFAGNWSVKSIVADGEELNVEELFAAAGSESSIGLNLENNGNASLSLPSQEPNKGSWKVSGNDTILLTIDGNDETVTLKDDKLVMSHETGGTKLELIFGK